MHTHVAGRAHSFADDHQQQQRAEPPKSPRFFGRKKNDASTEQHSSNTSQQHAAAEAAQSNAKGGNNYLSRFGPSRFIANIRRHLSSEKLQDLKEEDDTGESTTQHSNAQRLAPQITFAHPLHVNDYSSKAPSGYSQSTGAYSSTNHHTTGVQARKKRSLLDMARRKTTEIHYRPSHHSSTETPPQTSTHQPRDVRPSSPLERFKGFFGRNRSKENLATSSSGGNGSSASVRYTHMYVCQFL